PRAAAGLPGDGQRGQPGALRAPRLRGARPRRAARWSAAVDHAADPAPALIEEQRALGAARPDPWRPPAAGGPLAVAGCFCCFARGGSGDRAWAAAALGDEVAV